MGISIKEFCQIQRNEFVTMKLNPERNVKNNNSYKILSLVEDVKKGLKDLIKIESKKYKKFKMLKKIIVEQQNKISYVIDIKENDVSFYLIFPAQYKELFIEKVRSVYGNIKIEEADKLDTLNTSDTYFMEYKYDDALSLNVDKRDNYPLNTLLNVLEILKEDDRIRIIYNFRPLTGFEKNGFSMRYSETMKKIKNNESIIKNKKSGDFIREKALQMILDFFKEVDGLLSTIAGGKSTKEKEQEHNSSFTNLLFTQLNNNFELNKESRSKNTGYLVKTDIVVQSISQDEKRQNLNASAVTKAYGTISGNVGTKGNELVPVKASSKDRAINPYWTNMGLNPNIMSLDESGQLLQLPGKDLCEKFNIKFNNMVQVSPTNILMNGYIRLGQMEFKGQIYDMYHRDAWNPGNLPLLLIGEQGAGKTTYFVNYALDTRLKYDSLIYIDFIKKCEAATAIETVLRTTGEEPIVIDYTKKELQQALDFNELDIDTDDPDIRCDIANRKAQMLRVLVDSMVVKEPLSDSMAHYLFSAAQIVFLQKGASIRDVHKVLNNHHIRQEFIKLVPKELKEELSEEIQALNDLNESKNGDITGTKTSKVEGINTRISQLKMDRNLKHMYMKDGKDNINLVELIKSGKVILFKMPEKFFITPIAKNVLVTFLTLKIWTALKIVGDEESKRCHVIIDELFQAPTAMNIFRNTKDGGLDILPQARKYGGKFVFSCQDFTQLLPIWTNIKAAGGSIMLLKGVGEGNYNTLKSELNPEFAVEDVMKIPQYSALCIINTEEGKKKFIVKLPPAHPEYEKLVRK